LQAVRRRTKTGGVVLIDVLYIIKDTPSRNYDKELLYSLRSLERCCNDFNRVFITGRCPNFINKKNVVFLEEHDLLCPMLSHWWKVSQTIKKTDISDDFVLMYDDIFFTKPTKLENYPFFYRGTLSEVNEGSNTYQKSLQNARKWLEERQFPYLDYELHIPCVYNRQKFLELDDIFEKIKHTTPAMAVRSVYANMFEHDQPYRKDIKLRLSTDCVEWRIGDADCFSVSDWVFECNTLEWLKQHYPERSKYEK
jgi:hypothetical protein